MRASRPAALLLATLGGCVSYRPTIAPPRAAPLDPRDVAGYDCARLEDAIVRTDTVRWVLRQDGAVLETGSHKAARYTANIVLVPLLHGAWPDGGHAVLNAADRRLVDLLRAKRAKGCVPTPTADPARTDLESLDELEPLLAVDTRDALDARSRLLDGLRAPLPPALAPVPAPSASGTSQAEPVTARPAPR